MTNRVLSWMKTARWAASGGNSQPWQVRARENGTEITVDLTVDSEYRKHPSAMDIQGLAAALALGCLAKNLELAAANDGYALTSTTCHFGETYFDGRVRLIFQVHPGVQKKMTNEQIVARRTDRGAFHTDALPASFLTKLRSIVAGSPSEIQYFEFSSDSNRRKADLVAPLSEIEHVRWRNGPLLAGVLSEISFGKEISHELRKIPVTQLGVAVQDQWFIWMFRRFKSMRGLMKLGFDALPVRRAVYDFCRHSERVCFLQSNIDGSERDFEQAFEMGRVYQEQWLEANNNGISFQPLGLPLIALGYWRHQSQLEFTATHEGALEYATQQFEKLGVDLRQLVMGFRLGRTKKLAEKSPRMKAEDLVRD